MCGICGFTGAVEADLPTLKAMCDVMAHRGPDGEGQYLDDGIALGHRRLSLIDLEGGNQPMVRATGEHEARVTSPALGGGTSVAGAEAAAAKGDFAIVFNGEIYNYQDLRADLEAEGWAFQTHSDTEVLLTGYLAWGEAVLDRLRGMFAFAIWNRADPRSSSARATSSASSRSTTRWPTARAARSSSSRPRSSASSSTPPTSGRSTRRRSSSTCASSSRRCPRRSSRASSSWSPPTA